MPGRSGRFHVTGLEESECAFANVRKLVGHDWIESGFVETELDKATLSRLKIQRLRAAPARVGLQKIGSPP